MLPTLFVSHGAPTLAITDAPARDFLSHLASLLGEAPKAILVISAHWETAQPTVNVVERNDTIHDFGGFPAELYQMLYDAPGSRGLAERVRVLLAEADIPSAQDVERGLDHGAWVPLKLAYPAAEIPVVQLSVQTHLGPEHHLRLGRAVAALRQEGVLVIGSGSFTHDLSEFGTYRHVVEAAEPEWVTEFADWFDDALAVGDPGRLVNYRSLAPHASRNHPTEEHLLPLFTAFGAAGPDPAVERLHSSTTHGVLRMDVYAFGGVPA